MDFATILLGFAVLIFLFWLVNSVYVIKEWERGVVLRLGRMLPEAKGARVRVKKVAGLTLEVEPVKTPQSASS